MKNRFRSLLLAILLAAVSVAIGACGPEESATNSYTTSDHIHYDPGGGRCYTAVSVAPASTVTRQTTTTYATPPWCRRRLCSLVNEGSATTVTRRTTTSLSSGARSGCVSAPRSGYGAASVHRTGHGDPTTTTYETPPDTSTVTSETVGSAPAVTTTYRQKTYTTH